MCTIYTILERAIELNRLVKQLVNEDVTIYPDEVMSIHYYSLVYRKKMKLMSADATDEEIINEARLLTRDNFKRVSNECHDYLGKTVYIDKKTPIVIERINLARQNTIVITDKGRSYGIENLWIKE
jgi:ferritin-like protein